MEDLYLIEERWALTSWFAMTKTPAADGAAANGAAAAPRQAKKSAASEKKESKHYRPYVEEVNSREDFQPLLHCRVCIATVLGTTKPHRPHHMFCKENRNNCMEREEFQPTVPGHVLEYRHLERMIHLQRFRSPASLGNGMPAPAQETQTTPVTASVAAPSPVPAVTKEASVPDIQTNSTESCTIGTQTDSVRTAFPPKGGTAKSAGKVRAKRVPKPPLPRTLRPWLVVQPTHLRESSLVGAPMTYTLPLDSDIATTFNVCSQFPRMVMAKDGKTMHMCCCFSNAAYWQRKMPAGRSHHDKLCPKREVGRRVIKK